MQICNGQLVTSTNDGEAVTSLAMYPRQPFDFASRTGTIAFDVSNDSGGTHSAWPEFWVSDQPVPDPFTHEASWQSVPRNGFGIRFAGCTDGSGNASTCPGGFPQYVGVDSAIVVKNYVPNDSFNHGTLKVVGDQAVAESRAGQVNHYEVQVSATQINVYGTNAFSGTWNPDVDPLKHISTISNFGTLGFTRGLVWLEDVHYNGDKFNCPPTCQRTHSFTWANLGFDGPVLPRDLGFDVANKHVADSFPGSGVRAYENAYPVPPNTSIRLDAPGVTQADINAAAGALLVFNFYSQSVIPLHVAINGHDISEPWPFPDRTTFSPRTIGIPVPLSDVVAGDNLIGFSAGNYLEQVANIDLILAGAGGVVQP
jgi:hypothetical protein